MKAGLFGAAAVTLALSGCYYPGPYVYYPTVPANAAGVETIPPNSPDYPQPGSQSGSAQQPPASSQSAPPQAQGQSPGQAPPPPGYYPAPAYGYPAYGYPAYGYPVYGYPGYPVWGGPVIGFSFSGHWH